MSCSIKKSKRILIEDKDYNYLFVRDKIEFSLEHFTSEKSESISLKV